MSFIHSNLISCKDRESPDLLLRCSKDNLLELDNDEIIDDSSTNLTDIVISDDESNVDIKSIASDTTDILDPDIVDYIQRCSSEKLNISSPRISSSSSKQHQPIKNNSSFVRCKPLDQLLSKENMSPLIMRTNSGMTNVMSNASDKADISGAMIQQKYESNLEITDKCNARRFKSLSSSSISSKLTMTRQKPRRQMIILDDSDTDDSDTVYKNPQINTTNTRLKSLSYQGNKRSAKSAGNHVNNYRRCMKNWTMHETTPPTSESNESDDDFKHIHKKTINTHIAKSPEQRFIIQSINFKAKSRIRKLLKKKKSIDWLKQREVDGTLSNVNEIHQNVVSSNEEQIDFYRQWMQRYPHIEKQLRKDYNFPMGKRFSDWEQLGMIWYLLKTKKIARARTKKTWAEMIDDGYLKHRTMRSLHSHFVRKILPNIRKLSLPDNINDEFDYIIRNSDRGR